MAVISQAEARLALPGLTADDTDVALLLDRADAMCSAWCGYEASAESGSPTFASTSYTRYLRGPGGRDLQLPFWPIVSVTSIQDDPTEAFDGSSYLVASGDYSAMRDGVVRLKQTAAHGAWSESDAEVIKAVWTAGWATIPYAVKQAVITMVSVLWTTKATLGVESQDVGQGSVTPRKPTIPNEVKEMLRPYRLLGGWGTLP